jgi:hypothetical protein
MRGAHHAVKRADNSLAAFLWTMPGSRVRRGWSTSVKDSRRAGRGAGGVSIATWLKLVALEGRARSRKIEPCTVEALVSR